MEEWQNWYFKDDKVIYEYENLPDKEVDRSEFKEYAEIIYVEQIAEDDFIPMKLTEEEWDKEEIQFFNNYPNNGI